MQVDEINDRKTATTQESIHELIAGRWSPRSFDPNRPVSPAGLVAVLEAARWAPSCFGDEPWRYVVCDRFEDENVWQAALDCLSEKNQLWARNAPVLMLAVAESRFRNGRANRWAQYDTGAASVSLCLQATAQGMAAHQMGGFDSAKARETFQVPEQFTPMAMIALGYQADPEGVHEDFREQELAPRVRRPLGESFFKGKWAVAAA
jgi:nitroreductase